MAINLDAIQARADAATPGPWFIDPSEGRSYPWVCQSADDANDWLIASDADHYAGPNEDDDPQDDARFIAHARTDVPALVAELRAARECVETLRCLPMPLSEESQALNNNNFLRLFDAWIGHMVMPALNAYEQTTHDPGNREPSDA